MIPDKKTYLKLFIISLLFLSSCMQTAFYDSGSYHRAVELKVESLYLMDKATQSFDKHREEVEELKLKLRKAYEYARNISNNEESTQQWKLMIDPDKNLIGGFLRYWKESDTLNKAFIQNSKEQVNSAFNAIIALETGKIRNIK